MTTLNLVPVSLKMLSDIVTSYQVLSHLVTLSPIFDRKAMSVITLNSIQRLLKMLLNLGSSYHVL